MPTVSAVSTQLKINTVKINNGETNPTTGRIYTI